MCTQMHHDGSRTCRAHMTVRPHLCCFRNRWRAPAALAPRVSAAASTSTALSSSTPLNGLPRSAKPYLSSSSVLPSSP